MDAIRFPLSENSELLENCFDTGCRPTSIVRNHLNADCSEAAL